MLFSLALTVNLLWKLAIGNNYFVNLTADVLNYYLRKRAIDLELEIKNTIIFDYEIVDSEYGLSQFILSRSFLTKF